MEMQVLLAPANPRRERYAQQGGGLLRGGDPVSLIAYVRCGCGAQTTPHRRLRQSAAPMSCCDAAQLVNKQPVAGHTRSKLNVFLIRIRPGSRAGEHQP
jgi:hypothetical protein